MSLTKQEQDVMDSLVKAWNGFVELPVLHPWHNQEFMHAIHECQMIVMARPLIKELMNPTDGKVCEFCNRLLVNKEEIEFGYHTKCIPF